MIPDKTTKCHRTGFAKTCFECVTEHGCRLWKRVTLEADPNTPPGHAVKPVDHYDCVDSLLDLYLKDLLRRQLQTTATVDSLRNEVNQANSSGMANALLGINRELQRQTAAIEGHNPADMPKLIEN